MTAKPVTKDCLIGHAIGDALGVPVEFLSREQVRSCHITEMIGGDSGVPIRSQWIMSGVPAGAWSDDTSMTVAAMAAIENEKGKIVPEHIMKNFLDWWNSGLYTSLGSPFGLGGIVSESLTRFVKGTPPLKCGGTETRHNGNGSLMRILPFSLLCIASNKSEAETVELIGIGSSLTHAHDISKMSCFIYTEFLRILVQSKDKNAAFQHILDIDYKKYYSKEAIDALAQLLSPSFKSIKDTAISEKNGYVVPTLESALYSILTTTSFEQALLTSINMGYDTDTIGAVTGGLAGALYGYDAIPKRWLDKLKERQQLEELAVKYDQLLTAMHH